MEDKKSILVICTTDSMIWNFLIPHIQYWKTKGIEVDCAAAQTGFFYDELVDVYGMKIFKVQFDRNPLSIKNVFSYQKLKKICRNHSYDLIACQEPVGGVMGRAIGHITGSRVLYMAHGFHFYLGAPVLNWLCYYPVEKMLSRWTDMIITINHEDYRLAKSRFRSASVQYLKGIGIDLNKFKDIHINKTEEKRRLGLQSDATVLLSVGELSKRKNHEDIIRALALIKTNSVVYLICGEGGQRLRLERLSQKLGIQSRVKFLGFRKDVEQLYQLADIYVFPSLQEGLSVALMESMASGLPVIASSIRGNIDLIEDGKNGYLVKVHNVKQYAAKIKKLSEDAELRRRMGSENRMAIKKYDLQKIKQEYYSLIKECLSMQRKTDKSR